MERRADDGSRRYLKSELQYFIRENAALTEQRDRLAAALRALLECSRCTNDCAPDDMTCATNLADTALATAEQGGEA